MLNETFSQELTDPGLIAAQVETCTLLELLHDLQKRPADQLERYQPIIAMLEKELEIRFFNADTTPELLCPEQIIAHQSGDTGTQITPPSNQEPTTINLLGREFNVWQLGFFGLLAFVILKRL